MIGYAFCGSFCTFAASFNALQHLLETSYKILPIMSNCAYTTDTRFGKAADWVKNVETLCEKPILHTIVDAEPLGPKIHLDALILAPCTGNTLAKLALGITDSAVTMAAKAHLRNNRPLLLALATNDGLSANLRNIGTLLNRKNIYFVPLRQDDPVQKPYSLVANFERIPEALEAALHGKQLYPLFS